MGHNFLCCANRILVLSEKAMGITHAVKPVGNFANGAIESTAATHRPGLLAAYYQCYSNILLSLSSGTSGEMIERVRVGTLASALVDRPVKYDALNGCLTFPEYMVMIACLGHAPIHSLKTLREKRCSPSAPDVLMACGWGPGSNAKAQCRPR